MAKAVNVTPERGDAMPRAKDFDGDESKGKEVDKKTGDGISIMTTVARNWLITQNNADKYGVDMSKDGILTLLNDLVSKGRISAMIHRKEQSLVTDENGNHTLHDHLAIRIPNQSTGHQIYKYFPHAALQPCQENFLSIVKYVRKDTSGYWYKVHPEKLGEKLPDDQANYWQWGDIPEEAKTSSEDETQKGDNINALIVAAITEGLSDAEIMVKYPNSWRRPAELRKVRFAIMSQKYRPIYRDMTVVYIVANRLPRQVYELYPSDFRTYVVSDYTHPWDSYCAEETVVLLNFTGQMPWPELQRLMSGNYCTLPARFSDAVACYTTLIIVSPLTPKGLQKAKTYDTSNIETYLTNLRIYNDLEDAGTDYIRDPNTGIWRQLYLLPPHTP